ncbi:hypothetical protein TRAPUB_1554 [Trametes pubescens]|uniref:Uncharacterized protein n=1 Tax=Trametes pubescens TaxID=154538 RepID=A0A1M2VJ02_TRAPU|nr:hypothetical protein TRAPUB_1554 [Trametes pubescens]
MVSLLFASVVAACLESTFYGIFLVLSLVVLSFWIRRHASESPRPRWGALIWDLRRSPLVIVNLFLVVIVSAHWVVGIRRLLEAVVDQGDTAKATAYYADLRQPTDVIRSALMFVGMLVGDVTITYRVWLVWGRDYRAIIFPTVTVLGLAATVIGLMYRMLAATPNESIFAVEFNRWVISFCVATLIDTTYGTSMIVYRLWTTNRARKKHDLVTAGDESPILEAMTIFVESAALYSAWTAWYIVLYALHSPLQVVNSNCNPTITGISILLITVRVNAAGRPRVHSHSLPSMVAGGERPATVIQLGGDAIRLHAISLDMTRSVREGEGKDPRFTESEDG